jgi:hypothetical protein
VLIFEYFNTKQHFPLYIFERFSRNVYIRRNRYYYIGEIKILRNQYDLKSNPVNIETGTIKSVRINVVSGIKHVHLMNLNLFELFTHEFVELINNIGK